MIREWWGVGFCHQLKEETHGGGKSTCGRARVWPDNKNRKKQGKIGFGLTKKGQKKKIGKKEINRKNGERKREKTEKRNKKEKGKKRKTDDNYR